jgi:upstream activation factor subunit UAF30
MTKTEIVQEQESVTDISFEAVLTDLANIKKLTSDTVVKVKKCRDQVAKQTKAMAKKQKKGGVKREPSGFAKPTLISNELSTFLGKAQNIEMARTEVTRSLTEYIKTHNLQDPADKRTILPDKKLGKLLKVDKADKLTYFNLQRFLKPHFHSSTNPLSQ